MKNSEEMVNSLLERRDKYDAEQKKKRIIFTRTVTSMCCVCLVALLGFGLWQGDIFKSTPPVSDDSGISAGQDDAAGKGTNDEGLSNGEFTGALPHISGVLDGDSSDADRDGVKVISSYVPKNEIDAKYRIPANGEYVFTYPLMEAMKEYGDSVLYNVRIYVFEDGTKADDENNYDIKTEVERLDKSGFPVWIGEDANGQFYYAIKAKKSQLDNFVAGTEYGYFIKLAEGGTYLGGLIP